MTHAWQQWLDVLEQPAFVLDPASGAIVAANLRAGEMTGFQVHELSSLTIRDLHPFEMARFNEFAEKALDRGVHQSRGLTCRHRDGHHIAAEICASRVGLGDRYGLLAIVRPITSEQAVPTGVSDHDETGSEQLEFDRVQHRLAVTRHLLDHAPEMVLWVRPDGTIAYANITAARRLDIERSQMERMSIWDLDAQTNPAAFPDQIARFRTRGGATFETEMIDGAGNRFPVSVTVELVRTGEDEYLVSFSRDITREVQAREEARRYLSELAAVARRTSMSEMASALSHEINQPLTSISTYCRSALRLLDRDPLPLERVQHALENILKGTERTGRIVGKLRDYVKTHAPFREQTDLTALLEECRTLLGPETRYHSIELVLEYSRGLPPVVVDRILVQQVILNLARNGIEAMQEVSDPERTLTIRAEEAGDGALRISVQDTGPGVAPQIAPHLFEPFVSSKPQGMGIGLSLCRSIIESHDGTLWQDREAESGARFVLSLPVAHKTDPELRSGRASISAAYSSARTNGPRSSDGPPDPRK